MSDNLTSFERWWLNEGSGIPPLPGEDAEEHVKRVTAVAWANGAFCAAETPLPRTVANRGSVTQNLLGEQSFVADGVGDYVLAEDYAVLERQLCEAMEALEDCSSPMRLLVREAQKQGAQISGMAAYSFCYDAVQVRKIASDALKRLPPSPAPAKLEDVQ